VVVLEPGAVGATFPTVALDQPFQPGLLDYNASVSDPEASLVYVDFSLVGNETVVDVTCSTEGCEVFPLDPVQGGSRRRLLQGSAAEDDRGVTVELACGENVLSANVTSSSIEDQTFTFYLYRDCPPSPPPPSSPEIPTPSPPLANTTTLVLPAPTMDSEDSNSGMGSLGLGIGIAVGAAGLGLVLVSTFFVVRSRRRTRAASPAGDFHPPNKFTENADVLVSMMGAQAVGAPRLVAPGSCTKLGQNVFLMDVPRWPCSVSALEPGSRAEAGPGAEQRETVQSHCIEFDEEIVEDSSLASLAVSPGSVRANIARFEGGSGSQPATPSAHGNRGAPRPRGSEAVSDLRERFEKD